MKLPSVKEAEQLLEEAHEKNPGPWREHSYNVALAAHLIAECHPELDADATYILGLLHDIGRREGVTGMRHTLDGYTFLKALGYDDAARICLTHSLQLKEVHSIFGVWDCVPEEMAFIQSYIDELEYDDYDRLLQLCDALALAEGLCLLEKRFVDVALRYGVNEYTVPKWQKTLELKAHFEAFIGASLYSILPGVAQTTFGFNPVSPSSPRATS